MLGLVLLWVGAVLSLNGIWLMGKITDREIATINIFVGVLTLIVAVTGMLNAQDIGGFRANAYTLLFTFTYLWVAYNRFNKECDGRGLGWYSLFVALTVVPMVILTAGSALTTLDFWLVGCWAAWAILWFMYYLLLASGKNILGITAKFTLFCGIATGWLPGLAILFEVV